MAPGFSRAAEFGTPLTHHVPQGIPEALSWPPNLLLEVSIPPLTHLVPAGYIEAILWPSRRLKVSSLRHTIYGLCASWTPDALNLPLKTIEWVLISAHPSRTSYPVAPLGPLAGPAKLLKEHHVATLFTHFVAHASPMASAGRRKSSRNAPTCRRAARDSKMASRMPDCVVMEPRFGTLFTHSVPLNCPKAILWTSRRSYQVLPFFPPLFYSVCCALSLYICIFTNM